MPVQLGVCSAYEQAERGITNTGAIAMHKVLILIGTAGALVAGADEALSPWANHTHPTDKERSHVEEIATSSHHYQVVQCGTMDGRNCRSPMGCGNSRESAYVQTWDSNRSVRMENV